MQTIKVNICKAKNGNYEFSINGRCIANTARDSRHKALYCGSYPDLRYGWSWTDDMTLTKAIEEVKNRVTDFFHCLGIEVDFIEAS